MLLTITLTRPPATDLGFLLHKHPERVQEFALAVRQGARLLPGGDRRALHGRRCCSTSTRSGSCAAAAARRAALLDQYVNDRPYVASSFLSVAHRAGVRHGAGRAAARTGPSWRRQPLPLEARLAVAAVPRRRGVPAAAVRAARLRGRRRRGTRSTSASRSGATSRYFTVDAATATHASARPADAPLRPDPGARRRQALLGRRRRGREAAAPRRGLAGRPSRARADRPPLPQAPAQPRARGARAARRRGRAADADETAEARDGRGGGRRASRCSLQRAAARRGAGGAARRAARRACSTSAAARASCCARCSTDRQFDGDRRRGRLVPRARDRRATGCELDRLPPSAARAHQAAPRLADLPRPAARGLRRRRRGRGRSSTSTRRGCAAFERVLFEFARPGDGRRDDAERRVQRAVRRRCRPGSFRHRDHRFEWTRAEFEAWAGARRGAVRLRACASCRSARRTPELGAPTQMAVFSAMSRDSSRSPSCRSSS